MGVDILRCLHALILSAVVAVLLVVVHRVGLVLGPVSRGRLVRIGLRVVLVVASTVGSHPTSPVHGLHAAAAAATRCNATVNNQVREFPRIDLMEGEAYARMKKTKMKNTTTIAAKIHRP